MHQQKKYPRKLELKRTESILMQKQLSSLNLNENMEKFI